MGAVRCCHPAAVSTAYSYGVKSSKVVQMLGQQETETPDPYCCRCSTPNPSPSEPHLLSMHAAVCLRQCCEGIVEAVRHCQAATLHTQPTQQCVGLNHCLQCIRHPTSSTVSLGCGTLHAAEGQQERGRGHMWGSLTLMLLRTLKRSAMQFCRQEITGTHRTVLETGR